MGRTKIIVNPVAGAGKTLRRWPEVKSYLKSLGIEFDDVLTEAPGHATLLAREAAEKGYDTVVAVGGDGTIHEIVNGLNQSGQMAGVKLGIVSTGTGGDYIRSLGIPHSYLEAGKALLEPKIIKVDLGRVEYMVNGDKKSRIFVNFAGIGFDAEIVKVTTLKYKALGKAASYLMGLLEILVSYRNFEATLKYGGKTTTGRVCTVVLSIGKYGGGKMLVAPKAEIDDGLLDMMIIGDMSRPELFVNIPRIYNGTHLSLPKVSLNKITDLSIRTDRQMSLQADGELLGSPPATFSILPAALNIII